MALQKGTENKRQVALAAALFLIVIAGGAWEAKTYLFPSTPPRTVAPPAPMPALATAPKPSALRSTAAIATTAGPEAQKLSGGFDPTLRFDKLTLSEKITYEGAGRNIFSAITAPVAIPMPLKSARPSDLRPTVATAPAAPRAPEAPAIALKYFGYTIGKDRSIRGYFLHGEDIYAAHPGDIVDHRYKIGQLQPGSAEVTDMGYNHTETLALTAR